MRTLAIDRVGAGLLGLLLLAAGAAIIDWRFDLVDAWDRLDTGAVLETVDAEWFVWAAGAAAIVFGLIALWWLIAHIPRPLHGSVLLGAADADRVEVDVRSMAPALREDLEQHAPVDHVTSSRSRTGAGQLVRLRANVDPRADGESLRRAADHVTTSVTEAFPDGEVTVRILIDPPIRPGKRRTPRVH